MTLRDRESLIARIRVLRRVKGASPEPAADATTPVDAPRTDPLERRVAHLEQLLEGLQDSVHRETERQGRLIAELQAQIQPGAMGAALSKDARDRGL